MRGSTATRRGRAAVAAVEPERPAGNVLDDGVIVERIVGAIEAEARIAEAEGVATAADIDLALQLGAGHPPRTPRLR